MLLPKTQKGLSKSKEFYVYVHKRSTTDEVFYVGKGHGRRAWLHNRRSKHWHSIVKKHGLHVELVIFGVQEWYAFELEKSLIAYFGRDTLCNFTDGGEGSSGLVVSDATRLKMSISSKGKSFSETHKANMRGRTLTFEQRLAVSKAQTGRIRTPEQRAVMSAHRKGKPLSKEHAQKIADYRKGKPLSDATKDKIRQRQLAVVRDVVLCSSGKVFRCASDAEKWLRNNGFPKASNTAIGACCRGMRRSAYGFKWAYANKVLDT